MKIGIGEQAQQSNENSLEALLYERDRKRKSDSEVISKTYTHVHNTATHTHTHENIAEKTAKEVAGFILSIKAEPRVLGDTSTAHLIEGTEMGKDDRSSCCQFR